MCLNVIIERGGTRIPVKGGRVLVYIRRALFLVLKITCVLIVIGFVVTAVTPQGRVAIRTLLFVPQILPAIPIKPQEWVTRDPVWQSIQFPTKHGYGSADLISPARGNNHSAVLFFLGVVVDHPRDDPRVIALAEGLARSGMVVMIPWSRTQLQQRIAIEDIEDLVWAFEYLTGIETVDPTRVGMGGICTGAAMATVAAQDARIRDDVRFINSFASYYDATDFIKAISSRSRFYGEYVVPWDRDQLTYRVFRNHLLDGISNIGDRMVLDRMLIDHEQVDQAQIALLTNEGKTVYQLLQGVTYEETHDLVKQLSPSTTEFLRAISPSTNVGDLKARVLIMHDRSDKLVPSEESRRFADAVTDKTDTYFTEFSLFQNQIQVHVGEEADLGVWASSKEAFKLYMHMYNIMKEVS